MNKKDERYQVIKDLIESNKIIEFRQIFTYLPKTVLARDLVKNTGRMTDLINKAEKFSFEEMVQISELVGVDYNVIIKLIATQYFTKTSN